MYYLRNRIVIIGRTVFCSPDGEPNAIPISVYLSALNTVFSRVIATSNLFYCYYFDLVIFAVVFVT